MDADWAPDGQSLAVALDETTTRATVATVWAAFGLPGDVTDVDVGPDGSVRFS